MWCLYGVAQRVETTIEIGGGTYQLADLRKFQQQAIPEIDVPIESVSSFPAYWAYKASMLYYINGNWGVGFTGSFYSTGARNHYEDYSGYYKLDILLSSINAGVTLNRKFNLSQQVKLIPEISSGIKFSDISMSENLHVTTNLNSEEIELKSNGLWLEPRVRVLFQPITSIALGASVGYEYNLPSKNYLADDKQQYLQTHDGKVVRVGWSGLRAFLSVSYLW
jgi:hypothetical protein